MSKHAALAKVSKIGGWLSAPEASQLYDLARDAKGPIVELGSWLGRSTAVLALGSMAGNKQPVFAIDHFKGSDDVQVKEQFESGNRPSEQRLRANLDAAGCNGLVKILPVDALTELVQRHDVGMLQQRGEPSLP